MPFIRLLPSDASHRQIAASPDACEQGHAELLLRVLAVSGYGLWIWLGMGLALGVERLGQGDLRMPLLLGAVLVSAGLLLVCVRLPASAAWHGWQPSRHRWPTGPAWMALVTFLPALLVVGLGDGHGHTPEMRLAGVTLMLCSLVSLVYSVHHYRSQLSPGRQRMSSSLPVSRLVTAWYAGGLWLWLCAMVQGGPELPDGSDLWILLLLALALLLGLLEAMRWQLLDTRQAGRDPAEAPPLPPVRFVAAALVYVLPCAALLLTERFGGGLLAAALAVPSCLLGKVLEQHVYESALADGLGAEP